MAINKGYLTAKTDKESDEVYTPKYAVLPLLKWLKRFNDIDDKRSFSGTTIWCPFDAAENSKYVETFREAGYNVIATHIDNGQNFFTYEPSEHYDIIISNPPFSLKVDVLKRLQELNKPYAILLPLPSLQGQKIFPYLKENTQLIIFDKRINFYKNKDMKEVQKGVSFASIYVCKNFLPEDKQLIFEELNDSSK